MSSEEPIPDHVSVPDWHMEIVEERLARYGGVVEGRTWEEVEAELLEELKKD